MRKNMKFFIVLIAALVCIAGIASADTAVTFEPATLSLDQGSSAEVTLWLDQAPEGLAGYNMELSLEKPGLAEFTKVTYPSWGKLTREPVLPNQSVLLSAVDIERLVGNGSTRVELATITVGALSPGNTAVEITGAQFDADGGATLTPARGTLTVTVSGGGTPAPTTPVRTITVVLAAGILALAVVWNRHRRNT
mgnify:CR=1 FL=1